MRLVLLEKLSFAAQFLIFSLVVLVAGMTAVGVWVQQSIEQSVTSRTAGVTALYVDSFVSPLVQGLANGATLSADDRLALDRLLTRTPLGSQIVSFKIWSPQGEILYSSDRALLGRRFAVEAGLAEALTGDVVSSVSDLSSAENEYERAQWDSLIETYAPIRSEGTGAVFAASEFYQLPDALALAIREARTTTWAVVGLATVVMYLVLAGMTRRATRTISRQRQQLTDNVHELSTALEENRRLQARVSKAAARTTTLNERFLGRISADLHDGPAQSLALALLRIEHIAESDADESASGIREVDVVRSALTSALSELRSITKGLRVPNVEGISPCDAAMRAVTDFERITEARVETDCGGASGLGPIPVNITVYRVVQESLANSLRHAGDARRRVTVRSSDSAIDLEIADDGPGFEPSGLSGGSTLGIAGMRERVEMLGGIFVVDSGPESGTVVRASVPLGLVAADD